MAELWFECAQPLLARRTITLIFPTIMIYRKRSVSSRLFVYVILLLVCFFCFCPKHITFILG